MKLISTSELQGQETKSLKSKAIPEIELAAKYLNEANEEIKNINQY